MDTSEIDEAKLIARVTALCGDAAEADRWYRHEPIPAFGGLTSAQAFDAGHAKALTDYIEHIRFGGFA